MDTTIIVLIAIGVAALFLVFLLFFSGMVVNVGGQQVGIESGATASPCRRGASSRCRAKSASSRC